MKKFIASLMATIGMSSASHAAEKIETVDINKIRYTMPTVAADAIDYVMPTKETFEGAPQFHEDEWAQLEFFSKNRLPEIQKILKEYKAFEKANRTQHGWLKIYARKVARTQSVLAGISPKKLSSDTAYKLLPAPILVTSSRPLGQVKNGFALQLGENAEIYGLTSDDGIPVLGAHLAGADDMLLSRAFALLNSKYGLILVDWRQQFVIVSIAPDGNFDVWHP